MPLKVVFFTCLRIHFQRIDIEKALAIQRHSANYSIKQRPFHNICVFTVFGNLKHPSGKENQSNGSAGFRIHCIIWKVIVKAKSLSMLRSPNRSGNIHLFFHNIIPDSFTGPEQFRILCSVGNFCHTGIKINSTHRMSFCLILLPHRSSCLVILLLHISVIPEAFVMILFALFIKK